MTACPNSILKTCSKCKAAKALTEFYKDKIKSDGLCVHCKECTRARQAAYYAANVGKAKVSNAAYYAANVGKAMASQADYRAANSDKIRARKAAYNAANSDKIRARSAAYYAANADKMRVANVAYAKQRRATDPVFALNMRIRTLIRNSLRNNGYTKKTRSHTILGCDWGTFKTHIERQFTKGMNWDNRGTWHLDHIVPMASATTEADVIALNHFTNLRPLWAADNLAKSAAITHLL